MALLSNEKTLFRELNLVLPLNDKIKDVDSIPPSDFYSFLLHKLTELFKEKLDKGEIFETRSKTRPKSKSKSKNKNNDKPKPLGSYERLSKFVWEKSHVKKSTITMPYNSSHKLMKKHLASSLTMINRTKDDTTWYFTSESDKKMISAHDLSLLIKSLRFIIDNDFEKIKKLVRYLKNVATLLNILGLPIIWTLPIGLTINQSYLKTKSTSITPFMYSKIKLNLKVTVKNKFDVNKQIRALMPNLIHSLDGSSLVLLHEQFIRSLGSGCSIQFFSVHDCFGTTYEKVITLKTILASVYTDLYSSDPYLYKFDKSILDSIENNTDAKLDRENRTVQLPSTKSYTIHDLEWVLNKRILSPKTIRKRDSQNILI